MRTIGTALGLSLGLFLLFIAPAGGAVDPLYRKAEPSPEYTDADYSRYQLFAVCRPIEVNVGLRSPAAVRLGINEDSLYSLVVVRLQDAQIQTAAPDVTISLRAEVQLVDRGPLTQAQLDFLKTLFDPISQQAGYSPTWSSTVAFPITEDRTGFLKALAALLDQFIADYQTVNAVPCRLS